ncbi:MAG: alpha-E domain-containing protein [Verrucomicrobiae bacterium]|nr:alpha-E domain-containing protein [Verrucomicrobiae bacterium]MCB1087135.1 alpha-E domain-containing protein [Verrucomicrobiae bacterium]MCB1091070.1 alpha-E domain-containing protein [Verrucomicrobiae bacterium]
MLSRVADSLYWLSRYLERAENLARLVDVNRHDALDFIASEDNDRLWKPLLYATCTENAFAEARKIKAPHSSEVGGFIMFSQANHDSIRQCIAVARENARMVRDQISEEMWLELNSIHLFMQSSDAEDLWRRQPEALCREVIKFSLLFQGLTDATIVHDEGWQFVQLGKFIERADKTSRILDILTYFTEPERTELASVLRSCSGFSAFRAEFRGDVTLPNVMAFLLFSQSFPRSVRFCVRRLDGVLHAISGVPIGAFSNEAERLTGSVLAQLNFSSVDTVWQNGLHDYIDDLQQRLNDIGQRVFETYVLLPSEIRNVARADGLHMQLQWQQQQQ